MDYNKYKTIIENTTVPARLSDYEKENLYSKVTTFVDKNIPKKLYRFRICSERNFSALSRDELWFTNGSAMNDDFDARLYYNRSEIVEWIKSFATESGKLKIIDEILSQDKMPEQLKCVFPNSEVSCDILKNLDNKKIIDISQQLLGFLFENLDDELRKVTEHVQRFTKFACFSEKINSDMMWGQYSGNATGFALEYEFGKHNQLISDEDSQWKIWANLFPVIYDNKRLDATEYAVYLFKYKVLAQMAHRINYPCNQEWLNTIVPCPDEFMVSKLAIKKSKEWSREKEWRLFYTTDNSDWAGEEYSCAIYKPSRIYIGRKISSINQKIILHLAGEKNIPVYKMNFRDNSKTFTLNKVRIQ